MCIRDSRHPARGCLRGRSLRLRPAHPVGADRQGLHLDGRDQHQKRTFCRGSRTPRRSLRVPDLRPLLARRAASSLCRQRGHIGGFTDLPQPDLLFKLDARGSGSYHGGPLRAVSAAVREYPQNTGLKLQPRNDSEVDQWKVQPGGAPCPCCCRSC